MVCWRGAKRAATNASNAPYFGIGLFAAAAVSAVVVAAVLFTVQQYRLAIRLEQERIESEEQRRRTAEMGAAYEAEKRIADTLQEAFAQRELPKLGGLSLSATYAPASEEARVGGDWYDAVALPEERLLIAIGDVTGHGIDAAVAMNSARQHVISAALIDPDPGRILSRVNAELYDGVSPVITAIVGLVDARRCRVAYAAAGHPAPVLIEPGRPPRLLGVGSLPLGIARDTVYSAHEVQTEPGAMLVFYTGRRHRVFARRSARRSRASRRRARRRSEPRRQRCPWNLQTDFQPPPAGR